MSIIPFYMTEQIYAQISVSSSSSKSLKELAPKLRFPEFTEPWEKSSLGKLGTFAKGASLSKADITEEGTPLILYGELYTTYNEVANEVVRRTDKEVDLIQYSQIGDVIIPTSGESSEEIATATCVMLPNVILAGDLNIFRSTKVDGRVISYIINHVVNRDISRIAQGKSVVHIKTNELAKIHINYPNVNEQNKLISFLEMLTKRIETQEHLIKLLNMYKRGVLQQIFTQKLRFKNDDGSEYPEWKEIRLSEILKEYSERNSKSKYETVAVGKQGIRKRTDIYKRELSESTSNNKLIYKGTLTIGMGSTQIDIGILHEDITYSVSPAYSTFKINNCDAEFLDYYFQTINPELSAKYMVIGARQGKNINKKEFLNDIRKFPCIEEQEKIASFLNKIDEKIKNENNILVKLKEMKKSLLQQMFI